jgi:hypothetical protein
VSEPTDHKIRKKGHIEMSLDEEQRTARIAQKQVYPEVQTWNVRWESKRKKPDGNCAGSGDLLVDANSRAEVQRWMIKNHPDYNFVIEGTARKVSITNGKETLDVWLQSVTHSYIFVTAYGKTLTYPTQYWHVVWPKAKRSP